MASRKQKRGDDRADLPDLDNDSDDGLGRSGSGSGVPRWRQIEVMHERAQLRKMLDDLVMDFDELEMEVFGSEAEHDLLYRHEGDDDEEEEDEELEGVDDEDDDYEDDDFEELED